jgi:putative membrane protein
MTMDWITQHSKPVVDSILYSLLGTVILCVFFYVIEKILPFSMRKEIAEDHNTALGIILGAFIIGLSMIVSAAIRG